MRLVGSSWGPGSVDTAEGIAYQIPALVAYILCEVSTQISKDLYDM
jgi:hypothetical protein